MGGETHTFPAISISATTSAISQPSLGSSPGARPMPALPPTQPLRGLRGLLAGEGCRGSSLYHHSFQCGPALVTRTGGPWPFVGVSGLRGVGDETPSDPEPESGRLGGFGRGEDLGGCGHAASTPVGAKSSRRCVVWEAQDALAAIEVLAAQAAAAPAGSQSRSGFHSALPLVPLLLKPYC